MYSIAKCIKSRHPNVAEENKWYIVSKHNLNRNMMFISEDYVFDLDNIITIGDKIKGKYYTLDYPQSTIVFTGKLISFRPTEKYQFEIYDENFKTYVYCNEIFSIKPSI